MTSRVLCVFILKTSFPNRTAIQTGDMTYCTSSKSLTHSRLGKFAALVICMAP